MSKQGQLLLAFASTSTVFAIIPALASNLYSNVLMLAMERENFIPKESSLLFFEPYEINQGSSSWWIYGEDRKNYYYFTYQEERPYIFIAKSNSCTNFNKIEFSTWCEVRQGSPR